MTGSDATELAFTRTGVQGTGRPSVLLLHGLPGSGASWREVAVRLAANHDVIVPDLLGFGASPKPRALEELHAAAQAAALLHLLDRLGSERVAAVGHDFGGPVAVRLAALAGDRISHLGVLSGNVMPDTPIPFPLSAVGLPVVGRAMSKALFSRASLTMLLRTGCGRPRVRLDAASAIGDREQHRCIAAIFRGSLTRLDELYAPIAREAAALNLPRLVAWGTRDPLLPVAQGERVAATLRVPLTRYEDAGHFLPQERPAEVAAGIEALVGGAPRSSG